MLEPKKLMLVGDLHGNTNWAVHVINSAWALGCDTIVQLGDMGVWRDNYATNCYLSTVQDTLAENDMHLYWVDGNHEDHSRLVNDLAGTVPWDSVADMLWPTTPNITHQPRGYQWTWWGKTWMAVGGAVSVDKYRRTEGIDWWPQETLTDEQVEYCCRGPVDVIVSHDCPMGVDIPGLSPPGTWPQWVLYESDLHRRKLRQIWNETGATRLFHGHYHTRYDAPLGEGLVTGLDMDSTTLKLNTLILEGL